MPKKDWGSPDAQSVVLYGKRTDDNNWAYPFLVSTEGALAMVQSVVADANNGSSTNLAVGNAYTFTGTSSSTLGVAGIQVSLFADKNCKIQVQQSPDGTNWDIDDVFYYKASTSFGTTVQAISSFFRVIVSTNNETTTKFRLQTALCPIVEPLPRSLDENGNLKVATPMDSYGFEVENTPMGEMRTVIPVRLVGAGFEGTTIDSKFWTASPTTVSSTGTLVATAGAEITLTSGTGAAESATIYSIRRSRYIGGASLRYRSVVQLNGGTANNIRRWGVGWGSSLPTVTDGAWFQLNGTELNVVTSKSGTTSTVSLFNGNLGATYSIGTSVRTYEIYWTNSKVWFVISSELLHLVEASTATWSGTMSLNIFADNKNSAILPSSATLKIRTNTIYRLGEFKTQPIYYRVIGNAATHVLKLGAGILHKIIFNNTSGVSVELVDNVTGTTPSMGKITTASAAQGTWTYDMPFNTGLILITTGNDLDATVVYE